MGAAGGRKEDEVALLLRRAMLPDSEGRRLAQLLLSLRDEKRFGPFSFAQLNTLETASNEFVPIMRALLSDPTCLQEPEFEELFIELVLRCCPEKVQAIERTNAAFSQIQAKVQWDADLLASRRKHHKFY